MTKARPPTAFTPEFLEAYLSNIAQTGEKYAEKEVEGEAEGTEKVVEMYLRQFNGYKDSLEGMLKQAADALDYSGKKEDLAFPNAIEEIANVGFVDQHRIIFEQCFISLNRYAAALKILFPEHEKIAKIPVACQCEYSFYYTLPSDFVSTPIDQVILPENLPVPEGVDPEVYKQRFHELMTAIALYNVAIGEKKSTPSSIPKANVKFHFYGDDEEDAALTKVKQIQFDNIFGSIDYIPLSISFYNAAYRFGILTGNPTHVQFEESKTLKGKKSVINGGTELEFKDEYTPAVFKAVGDIFYSGEELKGMVVNNRPADKFHASNDGLGKGIYNIFAQQSQVMGMYISLIPELIIEQIKDSKKQQE